jgi:DNA repair protein RadC
MEIVAMNGIYETRLTKTDSGYQTSLVRVGETAAHYGTVKLTGCDDSKRFGETHLRSWFRDKCDQEEMIVVLLGTQNNVVNIIRSTRGTLNASLVHPREVFRAAVQQAAAAVLLAHNHPSGDSTPSQEDFSITDRLKKAGEIVGIQVLDHIVIGDQVVSIVEHQARRSWSTF